MSRHVLLMPLCIVAAGVATAAVLSSGRPAPAVAQAAPSIPAVRVLTAEPETVQLRIRSQGSVAPRTEADIVAEIGARVLRVSPSFEPGGFFEKGELLAELDPRDFELALEAAKALAARATAEAEFARATLARRELLASEGVSSAAILDEALRAARVADAREREAAVEVERAARDLERTRIVAPFAGRVRTQSIDVGQFVARGTPLGRIYSVDDADVSLPITDADLAQLDLPLGIEIDARDAPLAFLRARVAGVDREWPARVVRTEGEIDARTRMIQVVVRVEDPYGGEADAAGPPLAAGLFVEAEILGRRLADAIRLPRGAVRERGSERYVWIADEDNRLRRRPVDVARIEGDDLWITDGLQPGDRVSLSRPLGLRDGLAVRPVPQTERLVMHGADDEPRS